jgi:Domain of unknown function (DUF4390)
MVYFMHSYKKINFSLFKILTLLSALLLSFNLYAAPGAIHIKNAELIPVDERYILNSDFDLILNNVLEDALTKGVPLTFLVEFQITTPRTYWFDDEIITQSYRVSLSYHALSRQFLINRNKTQFSYTNLQQAKEALTKIKDWTVVDKSLLKKGEPYQAALRVRLDQSKLPKPLQVEASGSENWTLVSERYQWTPAFGL